MKAILISDIQALEQWGPSYASLLERVGGLEALYYSPGHLRASRDFVQSLGASFFFIAVVEDEKLSMVLPFHRVRDAAFGLRRTVSFWGESEAVFAGNVFQRILAAEFLPDAVDTAATLLKTRLRNEWDALDFRCVNLEDPNLEYFVSRFPSAMIKSSGMYNYYFDADTGLDRLLGAKQQSAIRRRRRNMERDVGEISIEIREAVGAAELDEIRRLHTQRQLDKENDGAFFLNPVEDRYIRALFDLWNRRKCVRG